MERRVGTGGGAHWPFSVLIVSVIERRIGPGAGSSRHSSPLEPDQTLHVVDKIGHADLQSRPGHADGSHEQSHALLLMSKDMLDTASNLRARRIGA
jgi:hypothetical protein